MTNEGVAPAFRAPPIQAYANRPIVTHRPVYVPPVEPSLTRPKTGRTDEWREKLLAITDPDLFWETVRKKEGW